LTRITSFVKSIAVGAYPNSGRSIFSCDSLILKIRPDIPIILCTGHSDTVSPEQAREAGIKEFLMKPLAKEELATVARRVLDTKFEG
jgi:FixJ family two-component response regulator